MSNNIIIITGLSGAGKTSTTHCLEDLGFFCLDNLPPVLLPQFLELIKHSKYKIQKTAIVIDIREKEFFKDAMKIINNLKEENVKFSIIFLEASSTILVQRFKEARRLHPLMNNGLNLLSAIRLEKKCLKELYEKADKIIDTTKLTPWDLKKKISSLFTKSLNNNLLININSFGYKYGVPLDSDFIFDVRFLPNPNYVSHLKDLTGLEKKASNYVKSSSLTKKFLLKLFDFLDFIVPQNIAEGKSFLSIGIGCTGGKHRSVVVAQEIAEYLIPRYNVRIEHRDIKKK